MNALWRIFCLDKVVGAWNIVKSNGGIIKSISALYQMDSLKEGRLVGKDEFGNEYYENNTYSFPKNRWVKYSQKVYLNYDASQVPPEWHRWVHHTTDEPPTTHPPERHRWIMKHEENWSGTSKQYVPYSTTRPKIESWQPGQQAGRNEDSIRRLQ